MKTEDKMVEMREKVGQIFSIIENKALGFQNFALNSKTKKPYGLPYEKNLNEMVVFNAVKNANILHVYFTFEAELKT